MEPVPCRIRIGVTGHRNLKNENEIKQTVDDVLKTEITRLFAQASLNLFDQLSVTPVT
jgi:hypothetical protein